MVMFNGADAQAGAEPASVVKTDADPAVGGELELLANELVERLRIQFTGSGSEYFRIWIVNLLLIVLTLGIYFPWARVRKLKYFYNNTRVGGHVLDFHGEPQKMLRGTLIVGGFFLAYSTVAGLSLWAGVVAAVAFVALWPVLWWSSLRFRLAHTSWRGMRFHFAGGWQDAWRVAGVPIAWLLIPLALAQVFWLGDVTTQARTPIGAAGLASVNAFYKFAAVAFFIWLMALPLFLYRTKRYQHGGFRFGQLAVELKSTPARVYTIFFTAIGLVIAIVLGAAVAVYIGVKIWLPFGLMLGVIAYGLIFIWPRAYLTATLQNSFWSRTGNKLIQFRSNLQPSDLGWLIFKNTLLGVVTLGLYWPFAAVATWRLRVESVHVKSQVPLDGLFDSIKRKSGDAAGDVGVELFGLDIAT